MSTSNVAVFGEGKHELGELLERALEVDQLPALPRLIHRLLEEPEGVTYTCQSFKYVQSVHGGGGKFAKKVIRAVDQAKQDGFTAAVIVIDRDRRPDGERILALQKGRDSIAERGYPPCAVGVAVEAFDAWMISDGNAIGLAGGNAAHSHPDPEEMDGKEGSGRHPKDRASQLFGSGSGLGAKYAAVACNLDMGRLEKQCPRGFKPFADEVRDKVSPAI